MKKTILTIFFIFLIGCSLQSEKKLEEKIGELKVQNNKLLEIQAKLDLKCKQAIINLDYAIQKRSLNLENLEEKKRQVCGDLDFVVNKILENNQKTVDLQLLIQEKTEFSSSK